MKQILPFKKELLFKTNVSEITSISLEHTLGLKSDDLISGEFIITGDYKMTEGSINREKFKFSLPFDIALDSRYDTKSLVIDIDNFYYEIVNNEALLVNIDVYIDGEEKKEVLKDVLDDVILGSEEDAMVGDSLVVDEKDLSRGNTSEVLSLNNDMECESKDLFKEEYSSSVDFSVPKKVGGIDFKSEEKEFNLFDSIDSNDTYVTYYVYIVKEGDSISSILEKYNVLKEDLEVYNKLDDLIPGTKLIIPARVNE